MGRRMQLQMGPSPLARTYLSNGGNGNLGNSLTLNGPPLGSASTSYALARITDHTQREERLAQIRLANWASELQRSLANERAQYEATARNERAIWLTEKLGECVQDGMLVAVPGSSRDAMNSTAEEVARIKEKVRRKLWGSPPLRRRTSSSSMSSASSSSAEAGDGRESRRQDPRQYFARRRSQQHYSHHQHQDPLGLLEVAADMRHKSLLVLELLGGLGILGGVAMWVSKQFGHLTAIEWLVGGWDRFWGCAGR